METWTKRAGVILGMKMIRQSLRYRLLADQVQFLERKIEGLRMIDSAMNAFALFVLENKVADLRDHIFNRLSDKIETYLLRPDEYRPLSAREVAAALEEPCADVQEALECLDNIIKISPEDYAPYGPEEAVYFMVH